MKIYGMIASFCILPVLGFTKISIANKITNKIHEHNCYKNVLLNHLAPHDKKTLNRTVYICKGATSSVPSGCYDNILLGFKNFPNEQTLDRIASVCTAKNLINRGQLAINRTEKPFKVDAISLN